MLIVAAIMPVSGILAAILGKLVTFFDARTIQFLGIALVFIPLERLIPFRPKQRLFRAQFGLDLLHFFVGGLIMVLGLRVTYVLMPVLTKWAGIHASRFSVQHLPVWGQFLCFEAGWTFLGYWLHRFEHSWRPLWRLHSIHESTRELDWLSAFRLHPLEPILFQVFTVVPLWFFGMSLPAAMAYKIYGYIFAHIQHSNVNIPIGPLKYIFPTPAFHRWHHARVYDESGKAIRSFRNFSEYPIWDLLFGTFELPKEKPVAYGNADKVPMDFLAQLAYPFGAHETVLTWKRRLSERIRFEWAAKVRTSVTPIHEAMETRLAAFSLLRTDPAEPSMIAMQPILGKENS